MASWRPTLGEKVDVTSFRPADPFDRLETGLDRLEVKISRATYVCVGFIAVCLFCVGVLLWMST